jgi:enoyl-CoA hydratase/carnithine racemase
MYEHIRYEVEEPIATLTLHRPERLNAWTEQMGREMKRAFSSAENDRRVVAVLVTGSGRGFCAGADLQGLGSLSVGGAFGGGEASAADVTPGDGTMGPSFRGDFSYPMSIPKPIIAAINGPCVGLGLPIALACDLRFASDQASFSTAFAKRGLVAEWGISWMLPRLVGVACALDLLMSARKVSAIEAQRIGLVNLVVPQAELLQTARDYALQIARTCSPTSVAVIKRQVLEHLTCTMAEAEQNAVQRMLESFSRPDFREGVASFLEKRSARFERLGS